MASVVEGIVKKIKVNDTVHAIASTAYGYCTTPAATQIKNVEMTGFSLETGVTVHIKFQYKNSADSPKLKFNGESDANAKDLVLYGTTAVGTTATTSGWNAGAVVSFTYDGTRWIRDQGYNTNSTSFTITANATDGLWDVQGTSGSNSITYAVNPYTTQQNSASFDTSETAPDGTTRLNYNGYLYATKLFSDETEVALSGHIHSYLSTIGWDNTNKILTQSVNGATATNILEIKAGNNITLAADVGELTIASTDQYVKQTASTSNSNYNVLFSQANLSTITSGNVYEAGYDANIYINPSSHLLNINNLSITSGTDSSISASTGQLTIETTTTSKPIYIKSKYTLYLTTTTSASIVFSTNNSERARFNTNGHFIPKLPSNSTVSNFSLGITNQRWKALYVGSADSYGDDYTPVYWNDGVPAAATHIIQHSTFTLNTTNNGSVSIGSGTTVSDEAEVVEIVVNGGYESLLSPISWSIDTLNHQIVLSATVDGTVTGYILYKK